MDENQTTNSTCEETRRDPTVLEFRDAANEVRQYAQWATDPVNKAHFDQVANQIEAAASQMELLRRHWLAGGANIVVAHHYQRRWVWKIAVAAGAAFGALGLYMLTALQS
jgi:hypothetical protein